MLLVNLLFLIDRRNARGPVDDSDSGFNIDFNEIKQDCQNINTQDSKMMFVYQSFEIQQMFHRYDHQLGLLNATHNTTMLIYKFAH